ncbi:MAG: putative hydroxymethylpyrimidine transporter CytX [Abditibacteriota bacterium]|nr:putative hydroxymethylpyrimidine transporter CytX [Abditibacteriota bacterium]
METRKTSLFENGLIWFGAAVSIAEILTGICFAPLGFARGLAAIIIGHVIGCVFLYLAGVIGGSAGKSAMEAAKTSFGSRGGLLFCILNVVQLLGWTSIMIYDGATAANGILGTGVRVWCAVIAGLIVLWLATGIRRLGFLNTVAFTCLFVLTLILSALVFTRGFVHGSLKDAMSFGAAIELAAAMPLSWLPLISDYTREAEKPKKASLVSTLVYGVVSCWMYVIGMSAAIYSSENDIASVMTGVGLGVWGLVIVVFSTVTTTYLDAFSAGVSASAVSKKLNSKWVAVAVALAGMAAAMFFRPDDITDFLYFIGSVFAPMIGVQIADFFVLKNGAEKAFRLPNLISWVIGFGVYRYLMTLDLICGNSLPDILVTILACLLINKLFAKKA